jgi:hypothetical protein
LEYKRVFDSGLFEKTKAALLALPVSVPAVGDKVKPDTAEEMNTDVATNHDEILRGQAEPRTRSEREHQRQAELLRVQEDLRSLPQLPRVPAELLKVQEESRGRAEHLSDLVEQRSREYHLQVKDRLKLRLIQEKRRLDPFILGRGGEDTILVYPFACDERLIESAIRDLGMIVSPPNRSIIDRKLESRGQFVTLYVKDYERLRPPEWLNDSLVDFWMEW